METETSSSIIDTTDKPSNLVIEPKQMNTKAIPLLPQLGAIAYNTFKEAVRNKILYNLLIFMSLLIFGSILIATLTVGEQSKIIADIGLASINLFGVLISIFLGVGLVSKEIEKRTVYTVLSKPISRTHFLIGKYFGLLMTLLVNSTIMSLGLCFALMFNEYRWGNTIWNIEWGIANAVFLIYLELMILTAVALLFSTFTTSTLSAIFSLSVYVIGHIGGDLVLISQKMESSVLHYFFTGIYYIIPNLKQFDVKGQVVHHIPIKSSYLFFSSSYTLIYVTILLTIASIVFQKRDF